VRSKKFGLILRAAAEIFAGQLPPADLPFLTISSFSSQLCWRCSALSSLAANSFLFFFNGLLAAEVAGSYCGGNLGKGGTTPEPAISCCAVVLGQIVYLFSFSIFLAKI
jgi:hypothetical protein